MLWNYSFNLAIYSWSFNFAVRVCRLLGWPETGLEYAEKGRALVVAVVGLVLLLEPGRVEVPFG